MPDATPEGAAPSHVTRLLRRLTSGETQVSNELFEEVYEQLQSLAQQRMARERPGHTLQPTALVHEAYLRLLGASDVSWENRSHFYGAAAEAMRRILVDHARRQGALKRGGDAQREPLDENQEASFADLSEIVAVDEALSRMQEEDPRGAEVIRLRFFAGLDVEETARVMGLSPRSVAREWTYARARLYRDLGSSDD